ncbi:MAG: ATP-binding protein [Holophaga sp.]|nr:ATP-binding protein [Holophaga sp.]
MLSVLGLSMALAVAFAYRMGLKGTAESRPIQHIATRIDEATFSNHQPDLRSLTQSDEIVRVARGLDRPDNPQVSLVLETARRVCGAGIVYVLNRAGTVVSCTRYEGGKTLTGNQYGFRPYFIAALHGNEAVYPAMGVTTGQRGLYRSTPIVLANRRIVGVLVVKASMDAIDAILVADPMPVFLVSPDGVIFASNQKDLLFHYVKPMKADELERIHASQQFGDQKLKPFPNLFGGKQTILFQGEHWSVSTRQILTDWTIMALARGGPAYLVNKNVVFTATGILGAMAITIALLASVIGAREKAEVLLRESEHKLRHANGIQALILGNSTVGIAFIRQGVFEWVNPRMSAILGQPQENIQGCSIRMIYASNEEYQRVESEAYPTMSQGGQFQAEVLCAGPDGVPFWSQILGKALDPEHPNDGSIWIFDDISVRKRTEIELRVYREHLEELVERRTTELREAKEAAEAATKAKSIFLASMSHELRTPLNVILGYAQLLNHTVRDPGNRDNLQRIHRAGEHLLGLINHVLSLSRIEAGKLTLDMQSFPTELFFKSIEDMARIRAVAKGLEFRLEVRQPFPEFLVGDPLKLRQILVNLLSNGMKFTQRGRVTLSVERMGTKVCFAVRDTGSGMSADEIPKLFQAFQQTQSGREVAEGTGLGLHISQAMVRLMGGNIEVESTVAQGSVFRFEIPMAEDPLALGQAAQAPLGLVQGQPPQRMLVVDDVEDNRTLLVRLLSSLGMEVREAGDGPSALALWEAWQPHAVWMDLRMPGMDGEETAERLRALETKLGRPRTVVIAMTASVLDMERDPLQVLRFDDLLVKPFAESELLDKLCRHCGLELATAAPAPVLPEAELAPRVEALDSAWIEAFDRSLVIGDRAEAQELLDGLPDRTLADAFSVHLQAFRFEALRQLIAPGRVHA